jgi:regulator of protease activity HflC (stomatin/prohibitin superfamily)
MKDVEIPHSMQRAMAKEAEAVREKRARLIKAAAEQEASIQLSEASKKIVENPAALELRRLQMLTEIGAENNTTTIIMIPSDLITLTQQLSAGIKPQIQTDNQVSERENSESDLLKKLDNI